MTCKRSIHMFNYSVIHSGSHASLLGIESLGSAHTRVNSIGKIREVSNNEEWSRIHISDRWYYYDQPNDEEQTENDQRKKKKKTERKKKYKLASDIWMNRKTVWNHSLWKCAHPLSIYDRLWFSMCIIFMCGLTTSYTKGLYQPVCMHESVSLTIFDIFIARIICIFVCETTQLQMHNCCDWPQLANPFSVFIRTV